MSIKSFTLDAESFDFASRKSFVLISTEYSAKDVGAKLGQEVLGQVRGEMVAMTRHRNSTVSTSLSVKNELTLSAGSPSCLSSHVCRWIQLVLSMAM